MGIFASAKPAIIICTRDRSRSVAFYRNILGLALVREDSFAAVFEMAGATLRVSHVADFAPLGHTILGFTVSDVRGVVQSLRENGVTFEHFPHISHDEDGIWTAAGGTVCVAWFKDPDGNLLSVTNA